MLDLHAVSSGGGTTLTNIGTILLGQDGQTTAGVPVRAGAQLAGWGGLTTIADTIRELRLLSQDQVDPQNGEYFVLGASSLIGSLHVDTTLPYKAGARVIAMRQNTGAANNIGYTIDRYGQGNRPTHLGNRIIASTTFGGALTAITWGSAAFTATIPNGSYAILGAWANALTNYGLLRFSHSDFGGLKPGFPVVDNINTAAARANVNLSSPPTALSDGMQFLTLGDIPVFRVTNAGTGLTIEAAAITADTPIVTLNLQKVG